MRTLKLLPLVFTCLCTAIPTLSAAKSDKPITVRVASYNVEFGKNATPEEIGKMLKPYKLDIIGFDEAPDGDWTARVGKVLGMEHSYVGKISSADHKDKYKSILSRTPLEGTKEHKLTSKSRGWNPASVVRATTKIDGVSFAFYSLHICKSKKKVGGHAHLLASKILPKETTERVIVVGDFNNKIGDAAMKTIEKSGFKATWSDLKIDVTKEFTYNALDPKKNLGVIDHILYNTSSKANVKDGGIIELKKPLSDHKPIWAEIVFPRNIEKVKQQKSATVSKSLTDWQPLYRGTLDDFRIYFRGQGYIDDVNKQDVFVAEPKQIHVRKGTNGLITTKVPYSHYHVKVDYRWGAKGGSMNAGLMSHIDLASECVKDNRPRSVEINMKADAPGSIWLASKLGPFASSFVDKDNRTYLPEDKGGAAHKASPFSKRTILARYPEAKKPNSKPHGEWNTLEAIVRGADSVEIIHNGHSVNLITNLRDTKGKTMEPGEPLVEGGIGLQSEGQEIFYRNFVIKKLKPADTSEDSTDKVNSPETK